MCRAKQVYTDPVWIIVGASVRWNVVWNLTSDLISLLSASHVPSTCPGHGAMPGGPCYRAVKPTF